MEFLVTTIVGASAVAIAYATFIWQKRGSGFKRIHYTAICEQLLLDRGDDAFESFNRGPISVHFEPEAHELVWPIVFKLKLANTGQAPVLPGDFSGPLSITFGNQCEFLGGVISVNRGRADEFLGSESAEFEGGRLKLTPFLFNPGDELTISGVVNGVLPDEGIVVSGRVAGMETFVRLSPRNQGITANLNVTSLMYESRRDWPPNPEVVVTVFVLPKFLPFDSFAPGSDRGDGISVRLDGVVVQRMHQILFVIHNFGNREIDLDQWLRFAVDRDTFLRLTKVSRGEAELDTNASSQTVEWDSRNVGVRGGCLAAGESISVTFIAAGDADSIRLLARPEALQNVQVARMILPDDPLEADLLEMSPTVLMATPAIYRGFHALKAQARRFMRADRRRLGR